MLYPDIIDRIHLLFTQVHLLFDSSAEGQYATDCPNSVYHDRLQGLSYYKYSLIFLSVGGIEPAASKCFTQKHLPAKCLILYAMCPLNSF